MATSALSLFPSRVPIVDTKGLATPEFARALAALFLRVGGFRGDGGADAFIQIFSADEITAETIAQEVFIPQQQEENAFTGDVQVPYAPLVEPEFTGTVSIYDKVDIGSPSSAASAYSFALNGSGYCEGAAGTVGFVFRNLTSGINAYIAIMAGDVFELNSAGGCVIKYNNATVGTFGATGFSTVAFGANGTAPQTAYALPVDGSDLPTTQSLANAIKAALIANGICA